MVSLNNILLLLVTAVTVSAEAYWVCQFLPYTLVSPLTSSSLALRPGQAIVWHWIGYRRSRL